MNKASLEENEKPTTEEMSVALSARAFAYDLLKCVFWKEPSKAFLKRLIEDELLQAIPLSESDMQLGRAIDTIRDYLKQSDPWSERGFHRLHWDYTRLFIGPGDVPAPPWESIYLGGERLHFSKNTLAVRNAYRKYNFLPARYGHDPDDHVGLELDFMHKLCELAKDKIEGNDEKGLLEILEGQKNFLEDHLLKWVPAWTDDIMKNAETDFYRGAARLVDIWLKLDLQLIEEFVAAI